VTLVAKTLITVRLDPDLIKEISKESKRISKTRSETIRTLIKSGLKTNG
jgi:metal-responsive CopG/Arc/MetJ family transcriptional regulator